MADTFLEKFSKAAGIASNRMMYKTADGFLVGALIAAISIGISKLPTNAEEAALPPQEEPQFTFEVTEETTISMDVSNAAALFTLGLYSSVGGFFGFAYGSISGVNRARKVFKESKTDEPVI